MKQELRSDRSRVLLAGASGYLGRAVLAELQRRQFEVHTLHRPDSAPVPDATHPIEAELTHPERLQAALADHRFDAVVSCIASRSGVAADAWAVDHDANLNLLAAARASGAEHFVLLSAICVQKPILAFQRAKLAFEEVLAASPIPSTVVRPTAFFKSLAGQVERVRQGRPFLVFGDGLLTRCKPISEADLARFMVDRLGETGFRSRTLPIGGPGPAITPREQGELLFQALGRRAKFKRVPPALLAGAARLLQLPGVFSQTLADKAELARIGHYYATESMLVWDDSTQRYSARATPETGTATLQGFYERVARDGMEGQELGAQRLFRPAGKGQGTASGRK